ncbi:numa1 [Pungitius sinensis]
MAMNLGVKALLGWVNALQLSNRAIAIDDLKDGAVLLKIVCMLKKQSNSGFTNSIEERFQLIADFVERDCRFSSTKGTSLSWDKIKDGVNATVETAKVLLLLVYHDVMNDRFTLDKLECDVEREIANLTGSFVMESNGCVYLSNGLDAYLTRKHLPVAREIFERSATTSTSNVSTISSLSEDDSPVFLRTQKINFVDMQTVASSSVSKSPLQDIMNTPKFQLRKLQRQMIKERDYRDGLEKELASKLTLIAQRESIIVQLQYRLDRMKEEQGDQDNVIRDQLNELQTKNNTLNTRLNEMLKQNKDFKINSSLMERKVDELLDENGALSSQVRTVSSQLALFEAEVVRLTETQASTREEWRSKMAHLQSELNQATTQKELLTEQIQILQGKISCLEDEINRANEEEVGENMGPVIERERYDTEINGLKNELESTFGSLKKAEVEIEAKTQQLVEYQKEMIQQKELLKQHKAQTEELIKAKDDLIEKERKEINDLLLHTEENVKSLETKLSAASSLLADKDQQINILRKEVSVLADKTQNHTMEIQTKDEMFAKLLVEKSNEQDIFSNKIQTLSFQVEDLSSSLKQAEQEIQLKQEQLSKTQQENVEQREVLQQQIVTCKEEIHKLSEEMQVKNEQLGVLKKESSQQVDLLEQEITSLKGQLEHLNDSLQKTEDEVQAQKVLLTKQEQEGAHQTDVLHQQLLASEERVRSAMQEIQTREEQMTMLKKESSQHSKLLHQEIQELKKEVERLRSSLKDAEINLQSKDELLAEQQLQSTRDVESLQSQMVAAQEEVQRLNTEIHAKEEQLTLLKTESTAHSVLLQQEIESLNKCIENVTNSLEVAENQAQAKEDLMAQKEQQSTLQIEMLGKQSAALDEEVKRLREQIQTKEEQLSTLEREGSTHSDGLQQQIESLKSRITDMAEALTKQEHGSARQTELLQQQLSSSEEEVRRMKEEILAKEEQMRLLKTDSAAQLELLHSEIQSLKVQMETLGSSQRKAEEDVQAKETIIAQQERENTQQREALQSLQEKVKEVEILHLQISSHEDEINKLKDSQSAKESLLLNAEQKLRLLQTELSAANQLVSDKDQTLITLREEVAAQVDLVQLAKEEAEANEKRLAEVKAENTNQTDLLQQEIRCLRGETEATSLKLLAKDQMLLESQRESAEQMDVLQRQLVSAEAELKRHEEAKAADLAQKEAVHVAAIKEKEALVQEKEVLTARLFQAEHNQKTLEKQLEVTLNEKEGLHQAKQATERRLESVLHQELEGFKLEKEKLVKEREKAIEMLKGNLQEQLSAKSEAAEHYKAQMEKAVSHYNGKKQLLQESHGEVVELKRSLEVKEREVKAATVENQLLKLDLDKAQTNEKTLLSRVASLEAQLAFADRNLREQNKIYGNGRSAAEPCHLEVPFALQSVDTRAQVKRTVSHDSLDQSSLEDSLNTTRKLSAPDESSTPFVRSSERLAAKRRGLKAESLETLYFTPINTRQVNREHKMEIDSAQRNLSSSVKRRRTTHHINITMTKKTPGGGEDEETFYSLASARSHPNLAGGHAAQPTSLELIDTPARTTGAASDQLIGLPGYRRSTVHLQTGTFCAGVENEPEGAPEDWRRIAELQARNKACLPHLKSSYPVESDTGRTTTFLFTDEELRMGDPSDTIRRASMMPGQLQDSLTSHRHSLMLGHSGAAAATRSHRLSLMPGQLPSNTVSYSQLRSPNGAKRSASTLSVHQTSPEKKVKGSCFPRPLTPKNKNSGSSSSHLRPALSPAGRRESMMFSIENTPKNSNYLKKGLNKLRSSTRKSPGKSSKKSPSETSARKCQENGPSRNVRTGVVRGGRIASSKSPQVASKAQRTASKSAKSPLTASARKMMSKLKV